MRVGRSARASAGHKLGQLVGDWFEEYFVLPLLDKVVDRLQLYLDSRFRKRPIRGEKIVWRDEDGNEVDYDFVMELAGDNDRIGIPVAFIESFWRRGARHSKDKARDDSDKLIPMRQAYPTARFLGVIASGDFTLPARELVQSRNIDLFYIPKSKVIAAFQQIGLQMDYPDRAPEKEKARLAAAFERGLTKEAKREGARRLINLIGSPVVKGYMDRVRASLRALPQEIRIKARKESTPVTFETVSDATTFVNHAEFDFSDPSEAFVYEITFSDGMEFERVVESINAVRDLHDKIALLVQHMTKLRD
jgi:hypothetical protein